MINITEEKDIKKWDELIDKYNGAPLLTSMYLEAFKNKNNDTLYLKIFDDDELIGLISGLSISSKFHPSRKIKFGNSAIFYSGPLLLKEDSMDDITASMIAYLKRKGFFKFTNKGYDQPVRINDIKEYKVFNYEEYMIYLEGGPERIKANMSKKMRQKLKKTNSFGLTFHIGSEPELIDVLEESMKQTQRSREDKGLGEYIWYYMDHLKKNTMKKQLKRGIAKVGYVKKEDRIISIQYFIMFSNRAYAVYMGSTNEGYDLEANPFVYYGIMEYLWNNQYLYYNLGGLGKYGREGLMRFKTGLGGKRIDRWVILSPFLQGRIFAKIIRFLSLIIRKFSKKDSMHNDGMD